MAGEAHANGRGSVSLQRGRARRRWPGSARGATDGCRNAHRIAGNKPDRRRLPLFFPSPPEALLHRTYTHQNDPCRSIKLPTEEVVLEGISGPDPSRCSGDEIHGDGTGQPPRRWSGQRRGTRVWGPPSDGDDDGRDGRCWNYLACGKGIQAAPYRRQPRRHSTPCSCDGMPVT